MTYKNNFFPKFPWTEDPYVNRTPSLSLSTASQRNNCNCREQNWTKNFTFLTWDGHHLEISESNHKTFLQAITSQALTHWGTIRFTKLPSARHDKIHKYSFRETITHKLPLSHTQVPPQRGTIRFRSPLLERQSHTSPPLSEAQRFTSPLLERQSHTIPPPQWGMIWV